jgi:F0F1-type ATP synthase delta subunit
MDHEVTFILPDLVAGKVDIMRLRRELDALYEFLHQAALRHDAGTEVKMPKTSRLLDELVKANNLNLLDRTQFEGTVAQLDNILAHAPQIHIAFSTDPSAAFVGRVVGWLRQNVDKGVLVQVGLQPSLAAGCVVRTTNKQFDLSLKKHFKDARPKLMEQLHEGVGA